MNRGSRIGTWLCALLMPASLAAHDVRPGYLELRETGPGRCAMLWKVPVIGSTDLGVHPLFPPGMHAIGATTLSGTDRWVVEQSVLACEGGLTGKRIIIDGLGDVLSDALVRIIRLDGTEQTIRLSAREPAFTIQAVPGHMEVASTYTALGIEHILLGVDHLLFVLALLIIVRSGRRLITTITAFTLAHSITLAAATLGLVHVPSPPVEAIIALSIVFVAAEIVHGHLGKPGLTARKPWIVAFTFGLLHGFGFAGALSEVGLPQYAIPIALLFFNVGVEIGQLLFISAVLIAILIAKQTRLRAPTWAWRIPPYAIGGIAAFWVIQRIAIF